MKTDLVLQMRKRVIRSEFNGKRESERKPLSLKLKTPRRRKRDRYNYNANDEIPLKPLKAGEIGDLRQVKEERHSREKDKGGIYHGMAHR